MLHGLNFMHEWREFTRQHEPLVFFRQFALDEKIVFILSLRFVPSLQSAVCILYLVCILYPVCSLQSAFCTDRFYEC